MAGERHSFDRSRPPLPGTPKDVRFPDWFEETLSNGLRVIVYEQHALPLAAINLVAHGGSFYDGAFPGLAGMTAELLTKGTASRSASDIVEEIEFLGGSIGSNAGWDSISIGASLLSRHLEQAMEVVADCARTPSFPDEEIERVREQRLADILQNQSSPGVLAWDRLSQAIYGVHPYGQSPDGDVASVSAMNAEQIRAFHSGRFVASNMVLLVVGDVDPSQLLQLAERHFGDMPQGEATPLPAQLPDITPARKVQIVDRPRAVQSSVFVGHVGLPRNHEDFIPAYLLNMLFGGYFGSRLNLNLREDKGYTYGAHARFDARRHAGPFSAGAEVRNEVTDASITEILFEMRRIREERVSDEELENVKSYVTGSFPLQIETPMQVAQRIMNIELYGLEKTYYNSFNSRILAVTAEDIQQVAQRCFHPEQAVIVAAGRGSLLRNTLERFGTVELFDAEGKRIPNVETQAQET
ncbi:insulinase family protein [bacterium]|nr:insulinase family protein [bacterium]